MEEKKNNSNFREKVLTNGRGFGILIERLLSGAPIEISLKESFKKSKKVLDKENEL